MIPFYRRIRNSRLLWPASIAALALASSFTSIGNGFAYDDIHIIKNNPVVHTLHGWWYLFRQTYWLTSGYIGALYRPLTVLSYAIQWKLGNGAPWVFHAFNVLLYMAVSVGLYWLVKLLVPSEKERSLIAWICAALFAVHPLHVEVVGNVVGQAELLCGLVLILSVGFYIKWRREEKLSPYRIATLMVLYPVACMFKEHGILLVPLLLAAEITAVDSLIPFKERFKRLRAFYLALIAIGAAFVWFRYMVLGDLRGDFPHLVWVGATWSTRFWTMCEASLDWFRLFLWPAKLSIDYAPGNVVVRHGPEPIMVATLTLFVSIIVLGFMLRKKAPLVTFGVLWMLITLSLVSNLIFPTGIVLAERTLFLPSAGFIMILVGAIAVLVTESSRYKKVWIQVFLGGILAILLVLGVIHSSRRQKIWRNNKEMFKAFFEDAPSDYRGAWIFSGALLRAGYDTESLRMLEVAVRFYDRDPEVLDELGHRYSFAGQCDKAIPILQKVLQIDPSRTRARNRLAICFMKQKKFDAAVEETIKGMKNPNQPRVALLALRIMLEKRKEARTASTSSR